jgi:Family of unknown function (DUF6194)
VESRTEKVEPDAILRELVGLDRGLRIEPYWGERSLFYNPGRAAPLGVLVASLKDHDGPNDASSELSREGVYRFAFGMAPDSYDERFGPTPPRPPKGGVVELPGYEPTRLRVLMPHPVYAWMRWVQILAPTTAEFEPLRPLLAESLELAKAKWGRR